MSQLKAQLRRDGFTFKQFFVAHDRCAMKVGTDGILLGAWAPVAGVKRILDIGTGSGLQALMLAQRTEEHVTIDAVELDPQAARQASENAADSPWAERIRVECADVLTWAPEQTARYDLIVSNPPYFTPGVECGTPERERARYTGSLDHKALLTSAAELISEEGFSAWSCLKARVIPSLRSHMRSAGICVFVPIFRIRKDAYRTACCWHSRRKRASALSTGWSFVGQTSVIPKITQL